MEGGGEVEERDFNFLLGAVGHTINHYILYKYELKELKSQVRKNKIKSERENNINSV